MKQQLLKKNPRVFVGNISALNVKIKGTVPPTPMPAMKRHKDKKKIDDVRAERTPEIAFTPRVRSNALRLPIASPK